MKKILLIACWFLSAVPLGVATLGCPSVDEDALIATTIGAGVSAGFISQGDETAANTSTQLFGTLATDIKGFHAGMTTQAIVIQATNDVLSFLASEEPNSKFLEELQIAETTITGILSDIGAPAPVALSARTARVATAAPPKTAAAFKAQWNAALAARPVAGMQMLK